MGAKWHATTDEYWWRFMQAKSLPSVHVVCVGNKNKLITITGPIIEDWDAYYNNICDIVYQLILAINTQRSDCEITHIHSLECYAKLQSANRRRQHILVPCSHRI